jgi:hypothetical protein
LHYVRLSSCSYRVNGNICKMKLSEIKAKQRKRVNI